MSGLPAATVRRLQKLPQIPSVWEGDRHPFSGRLFLGSQIGPEVQEGECILWVDGMQGVVRAMEVVPPNSGIEPMVRTLILAMERPHGALPARPQKIVVRDREVQFFLRGVLHDLNIKVEWQPELPLIDEILHSFAEPQEQQPLLPAEYSDRLTQTALTLWREAPWNYLEDHQVLAIELNQWDLETLYVSVMGRLGMEYGVLFYRSLPSLKQFRQAAGQPGTPEEMEEIFLRQDCLYLTFQPRHSELEDLPDLDLAELEASEIEPTFGSIHPLEGLRVGLQEEEAAALLVAMEALHRFLKQHRKRLEREFSACQGRYRIPNPQSGDRDQVPETSERSKEGLLSVQVRTLPEVAAELLALEEEQEATSPMLLRDDLVPEGAQLGLGVLPWATVEALRVAGQLHPLPHSKLVERGEGLPVVIVRTSRSKAKRFIENLQGEGGPQGICFNTGVDPLAGDRYDLEILQTGNRNLYLFGEFPEDDPIHSMARRQWEQRCRKTGGYCGLVVAMGGTSMRPELEIRHILALFEMQALNPQRLGLGPMVRISHQFPLP